MQYLSHRDAAGDVHKSDNFRDPSATKRLRVSLSTRKFFNNIISMITKRSITLLSGLVFVTSLFVLAVGHTSHHGNIKNEHRSNNLTRSNSNDESQNTVSDETDYHHKHHHEEAAEPEITKR